MFNIDLFEKKYNIMCYLFIVFDLSIENVLNA